MLVIEHAPKPRTPDRWLCRCDCGQPEIVTGVELDSGTSDCGCLHLERMEASRFRHGHNSRKFVSPTYKSWTAMKSRCHNPKDTSWPYYGARGIKVCERWQNFPAFLEDMGERPKGTSIHRIKSRGNYEPDNCKWATIAEQRAGQKPNVPVKLNGETMPALHAARLLGVPQRTFYGWVSKHGAAKAIRMAKRLRS